MVRVCCNGAVETDFNISIAYQPFKQIEVWGPLDGLALLAMHGLERVAYEPHPDEPQGAMESISTKRNRNFSPTRFGYSH